jgi:hypothetical protein
LPSKTSWPVSRCCLPVSFIRLLKYALNYSGLCTEMQEQSGIFKVGARPRPLTSRKVPAGEGREGRQRRPLMPAEETTPRRQRRWATPRRATMATKTAGRGDWGLTSLEKPL